MNGHAIDQNLSLLGPVEALEERDARRLARATRPHERHHLARPARERDVLEDRQLGSRRIAELDVPELDGALERRGRLVGRRRHLQLRPDVQVLEDLFGGARRIHQARVDAGEALEARAQRQLVDDKGHEVAARRLLGGHQVGAERQHGHGHAQLRDLDGPVVGGVHARLCHK